MTQGINAQSAAAPYDNRLNGKASSGNTRDDEAAPRRAEKKADAEQAAVKAQQVAKEVLGTEEMTDKAKEGSGRVDTYA